MYFLIFKNKSYTTISFRKNIFNFDFKIIKKIFRLGIPASLSFAIMSLGMFANNSILSEADKNPSNEDYVAVSNGLELSQTIQGDNKITRYKHRYPIPAYLIAIAITNYEIYTHQVPNNGNPFDIVNYVYPESLIDVQALAGDSTDNVPGIPGIGMKTAAELINRFKTLDNLFNNIEKIEQTKRREKRKEDLQ